MLSSQPDVPAPGKWTKLGSVLSFLLMGVHCCGYLAHVFKASLDNMPVQKAEKPDAAADEEIDPALNSSLHWSAVHGKRARNGLKVTGQPEVKFQVLILAVLQEVTRYMTYWHLHAQKRQSTGSSKVAPLLDVVNVRFSPYIMLLQYLSSLLLRDSGRALLACPGFQRVRNWELNSPLEVRCLRRMVMLTASWIFRRHIRFANEPPFSTCVACHNYEPVTTTIMMR